jgi:flagella basal body P-ring formation protein FlgA
MARTAYLPVTQLSVSTRLSASTRPLAGRSVARPFSLLAAAFLMAMLWLVAPGVDAAEGDAASSLKLFLQRETTGLPGRVEIAIGNLDPKLNLAPCQHVEPFVPPGTRLMGRAMLGLRCLDAAAWVAYLPVEIHLWAQALVAAGPFSVNQSMAEADVRMEEVDLAREPGALTQPAQLADKMLLRGVAPGQVLRSEYFRQRPLLNAGDMVTVVYHGPGFTVSTEARALSQAVAGQSVRVQTSTGKTLSGVAQSGRLVDVQF